MIIEHPQSFAKSMSKYGCYFFCLIDIATEITNRSYDPMSIALECINLGYIDFNPNNYDDTDNFFIRNPCGVLNVLTHRRFSVSKQNATYSPKRDEYVVIRYIIDGKVTDGHFVRKHFDPIQGSVHKKYGKVESYRVFKEIK